MTREERRKAVEELLGGSEKSVGVESGSPGDNLCAAGCCNKNDGTEVTKKSPRKSPKKHSPDTSFTCSEEGPVCSICLDGYEATDLVFKSKSCPHMFHGECLFSWLERRNNTVSEEN